MVAAVTGSWERGMMRVFWRSRRERERGANLVEFALVLPLLLLMLVGVADLGRAFTTYIAITNAAREGARYASRWPNYRDQIVEAVIEEAALSGLTLEDTEEQIEIEGLQGLSGETIVVTIRYDFPLILGGLIGVADGTITLGNRTSMVIFGLPEPE
jgi:Flp pilus assembly protein TadG